MKNQVLVEIEYSGNNFSAYVSELPGCVSVADTPKEMEESIKEAISFHVEGSLEDGDSVPDKFRGQYELAFQFDTQGLLHYYKGIFQNAALERITGIHQKQLAHYASGLRKPRPETAKKIENALHRLGEELLAVRL